MPTLTIGGFQAPRKKSVPKIRDYDGKTLISFEGPSSDKPRESFMAKHTGAFLRQVKLSRWVEIQKEDETTLELEYNVVSMKDCNGNMVLGNYVLIKGQEVKRLGIEDLRAKLWARHDGQNIRAFSITEYKVWAETLRHFSKHYCQFGAY